MIKHFISITWKIAERLYIFSILFYFLDIMKLKGLLVALVAAFGFTLLSLIVMTYSSIKELEDKKQVLNK
jgi:cytochrome c oxidase subunit IV